MDLKTFKKVSWLIAIPFGFLLSTLLFDLGDTYFIFSVGLLCAVSLICIIIVAYSVKKSFRSKIPCRECGSIMEYPFEKCSECGWIPNGRYKDQQLKFKAAYEKGSRTYDDEDA